MKLIPIYTIDGSYSKEDIECLLQQGVNSFRINPARIGLDKAEEVLYKIEMNAEKYNISTELFMDTQGNKSRLQMPYKYKTLKENLIISPYPSFDLCIPNDLFEQIEINDIIVIYADAKVKIKIKKIYDNGTAQCELLSNDNIVKRNSHIQIVNRYIPNTGLHANDINIINFAIKHNVQNICLSFTDECTCIKEAKEIIGQDSKIRLYAKLESVYSINNIESILKVSDGLLIGRDDLSKECSHDLIQEYVNKAIVLCNASNKSFIPASNYFLDIIKGNCETNNDINLLYTYDVDMYIYCNESVIYPGVSNILKIKKYIETLNKEVGGYID